MRKTPTELIAELETNRTGYKTCALFVVFESTTIVIDTDDGNRLQLLTEAISAGGVPFAWGPNKPGKLEFTLLPEWETNLGQMTISARSSKVPKSTSKSTTNLRSY
jgi:hypothetical protein